jgi:hypothetical protein
VVTPMRTGSAAKAGVKARTQPAAKVILKAIDVSLAKRRLSRG